MAKNPNLNLNQEASTQDPSNQISSLEEEIYSVQETQYALNLLTLYLSDHEFLRTKGILRASVAKSEIDAAQKSLMTAIKSAKENHVCKIEKILTQTQLDDTLLLGNLFKRLLMHTRLFPIETEDTKKLILDLKNKIAPLTPEQAPPQEVINDSIINFTKELLCNENRKLQQAGCFLYQYLHIAYLLGQEQQSLKIPEKMTHGNIATVLAPNFIHALGLGGEENFMSLNTTLISCLTHSASKGHFKSILNVFLQSLELSLHQTYTANAKTYTQNKSILETKQKAFTQKMQDTTFEKYLARNQISAEKVVEFYQNNIRILQELQKKQKKKPINNQSSLEIWSENLKKRSLYHDETWLNWHITQLRFDQKLKNESPEEIKDIALLNEELVIFENALKAGITDEAKHTHPAPTNEEKQQLENIQNQHRALKTEQSKNKNKLEFLSRLMDQLGVSSAIPRSLTKFSSASEVKTPFVPLVFTRYKSYSGPLSEQLSKTSPPRVETTTEEKPPNTSTNRLTTVNFTPS